MTLNTSTLKIGTVLHGPKYSYKIVKILGEGTFGITYLANVIIEGHLGSLECNTYVAIKELFIKNLNYRNKANEVSCINNDIFEKYKHQFIHEAKIISKFNHPNIIKIVGTFETNNSLYNVMEYIKGINLERYILNNKALDEEKSVKIINQICSAVKCLHEKKILHLDIKPSNIILKDDGNAKLIDFGLSRQYDDKDLTETCRLNFFATPGYAPLESISSNYALKFQPAIDVYSLGATLYTMLTGHRPPEAINILNDGFPTHKLKNNNISCVTIDLINRAMQPLYKDRIQSVDEFIGLLPTFKSNEYTEKQYDVEDDYSQHQSSKVATEIVMKDKIINDFMNNSGIKFFVFKNDKLISIIGTGYVAVGNENNNFVEIISKGCSFEKAEFCFENDFTTNYYYLSLEECIEKEKIFKDSELVITYRTFDDFLYILRLLKKYIDVLKCRRIIRENHVIAYGYNLENKQLEDDEKIILINYCNLSCCFNIDGGVYEILNKDKGITENNDIDKTIILSSLDSFVYLSSAVSRLWSTFTHKIISNIVLLDCTAFDMYITVLDKNLKYTGGGEISIKANSYIPSKTKVQVFSINYDDDIVFLLNKHAFPLNVSTYFGNIPKLLDVVVQINSEASVSIILKDKNSSKSKDIPLIDLV